VDDEVEQNGSQRSTFAQQKIGCLVPKDNSETNHLQRELLSLKLDISCQYVKIQISKCHPNKYNVFNQVALLSISCFGDIIGHENEYIKALKSINPSEALYLDQVYTNVTLTSQNSNNVSIDHSSRTISLDQSISNTGSSANLTLLNRKNSL
jgi:hypothetical protein